MAKVVCLQEPQEACDVKVSIVAHGDNEDEHMQSVVMHATSSLLSEIPFFAASLREPWQQLQQKTGSGKLICVIELECAAQSSPEDYIACFKFLLKPRPPEMLIKSVSGAAKVMRCADHLLFKDCVEMCMAYLAAAVWTEEEESAIRNAVSGMGLALSMDLAERLHQKLDETRAFREFFIRLTLTGSESSNFLMGHVETVVKDSVTKAPPELVESFYKPLFMEVWLELTHELFQKFAPSHILHHPVSTLWNFNNWLTFTYTLLVHTDAKVELAKAIAVEVSAQKGKLDITAEPKVELRAPTEKQLSFVLTNIFEGAISGEHGAMIFLSTFERASLLTAWVPVVAMIKNEKMHGAFKNVFSTLPPQHPSTIRLVMVYKTRPFFKACYVWWRSAMSKVFKHAHFMVDHVGHLNNVDHCIKILAGEHE